MSGLPDAPNEHVQEEDDGEWQRHVVEDLSNHGGVGEDAEEDLDNYEGDDSYDVHHIPALVGITGILYQRDPAEDKADDG